MQSENADSRESRIRAPIDPSRFQKVINRALYLPLALAMLLCTVFITLILQLVSTARHVEHSNLVISEARHAFQLIVDAETGMRGYVATGNTVFLEPYDAANGALPSELTRFIDLVAGEPAQIRRLQTVEAGLASWQRFAANAIEVRRSQGTVDSQLRLEAGKTQMDGLRRIFGDLISSEEVLRDQHTSQTRETLQLSLVAILIFSMGFGLFLALFARSQLLAVSLSYRESLRSQVEQNDALKEEEWLRSCQTELALRLSGASRLEELAQQALDRLCHQVGAQVGVLYIRADEVGELRLAAARAVAAEDRQRLPARVRVGETLVGQAAADRKLLEVAGLGDEELRIRSGLADSRPRHLLVAPAVADDVATAVIELGFHQPVRERQRELLRRVSEQLARSLQTAIFRERLQELLEESRRQAEELQAQQEELRVNNEELQEQGQALRESQVLLEGQQSELEQTNTRLQEQATAMERQTDLLRERNLDLSAARTKVEQKARELEQTSHYKSQFLANMSHELRTPLNSTLILAQLLLNNSRGNLDAEQLEYARTILASCNDLLTLINDILDLSRIEAGKVEIRAEMVELDGLQASLKRIFEPLAREKAIDFKIEAAPDAPASLRTDRTRLEQILRNLLSNAIKFTARGSVQLRIAKEEGERVRFQVQDTGIGIPPEQQTVVFEAFQQGEGSTNRKYGGTGLGLTISRDLAQLLGGEVALESAPGQGSTFSLSLPLAGPSSASVPVKTPPISGAQQHESRDQAPAAPTGYLRKPPRADDLTRTLTELRSRISSGIKRVLVVEDDDVQRDEVCRLIASDDVRVTAAGTAAAALEELRRTPVDCLILDLRLPDMSGFELLERISGGVKQLGAAPPVIIHTARALTADEENRLQKYSRSIIVKGARSPERLLSEVTLFLHQVDGELPPDRLSPLLEIRNRERSFEGRTILLADDDVRNIFALSAALENRGARVVIARNGREAVQRVLETGSDQMPPIDLALMDIMMPEMDGYEAIRRIRANPACSDLPIIAVTAKAMPDDQEKCLEVGANDYLAKPIDLGKLLSLIRVWMPGRKMAG